MTNRVAWVAGAIALVVAGCTTAPRWRVQFRAASIREATVRVDARIRSVSCDGEILFQTDIARDGGGMSAPAIAPGVVAFEALAIDADCRIVARACQVISLPTSEDVVLVIDSVSPSALCPADACAAGRCSSIDAGSADVGVGVGDAGRDAAIGDAGTDASSVDVAVAPIPDAPMLDARVSMVDAPADAPPDAGPRDDVFSGPDAWLPVAPEVLFPWNGVPTGTWRPVSGDVPDPPRRPVVRWEESPGALSYAIELVACDERDLSRCDFSVLAARVVVDDLTREARPPTDLDVATTAPGGRRYAFRVGACATASGMSCAFAPTRYVDVGRQVGDLDGDGIGELVVRRASTIEAHRGTGTSPSSVVMIASGSTLGAVAYAGDVDADGRGDVVMSVGGPTGRWEVRDVAGSVLGGEDGGDASDDLARVVAGIGDVDGDGFADFAIGVPGRREVRVQLGGAPLDPSERIVLGAEPSLATFGLEIAAAGDRDRDGLADVAIASRTEVGMVRVEVFSMASRVARRIETMDVPSGETDPMTQPNPVSLAGGHDLDGDGGPDLAVGLGLRDEVLVWLSDGTTGTYSSMGQPGRSVAMGDLAGSGLARVVMGAPRFVQPTWGETGAYGHLSYLGTPFATYILIINREAFGTFVTSVDLDGDGRDDMATFGAAGTVGHVGTFRDGMVGGGANFRFLTGNGARALAR